MTRWQCESLLNALETEKTYSNWQVKEAEQKKIMAMGEREGFSIMKVADAYSVRLRTKLGYGSSDIRGLFS